MIKIITDELNDHLKISNLIHSLSNEVAQSAQLCINCLNNGGKILLFGNGGSASDAQHIAAELVGKYKSVRKGLPAISLNTDTSAITSIGNDFGFQNIFSRQIEALANEGDIVIGLSTSGESENIISALKLSSKLGCKSIGLSGKKGGLMKNICDVNLIVPSDDTPRIQEMHILIGHIICHLIDREFNV